MRVAGVESVVLRFNDGKTIKLDDPSVEFIRTDRVVIGNKEKEQYLWKINATHVGRPSRAVKGI